MSLGGFGGMILQGRTGVPEENIFFNQIPYGPVCDQARTTAVRDWRQTRIAMTRGVLKSALEDA